MESRNAFICAAIVPNRVGREAQEHAVRLRQLARRDHRVGLALGRRVHLTQHPPMRAVGIS
jgi:hypothetical protein